MRGRRFDVRGRLSRALSALDEALDRAWAALSRGGRFSGLVDLLSQVVAWLPARQGRRDQAGGLSRVAAWRPDLRIRGRRFGIGERLFCAFAAVAAMTVIAAVTASLLFSHVGSLLQGVAAKNIPEVIATLELARETQSLAAGAPGLLAAVNQEQRQRQLKALQDLQGMVRQRLDALATLDSGRHSIEHLLQLNSALNDKLAGLDRLVDAGIDLRESLADADREVAAAEAKLLEILGPAVATAEAAINIITTTGDAGSADAGTVDPGATPLALVHRHMLLVQKLTDLADKINAASGLLVRAARAPDGAAVEALRKEFAGIGEQIAHQIAIVETLEPAISLHEAAATLLAQGKDGTTLFDTRSHELKARRDGQKILTEASAIIADLSAEVGSEVDAVRRATDAATGRSNAAIGFGTVVMLAIASISVAGAFLFVWLYIGRNLVARLVGVERTMARIAGGELSVTIAGTQSGDEIGHMAQALEVFRDGLVRADALAAEQARERDEKQRRAGAVEAMIGGFDASAGAALASVADAVVELQGSAERMASTTKRAAVQADEVRDRIGAGGGECRDRRRGDRGAVELGRRDRQPGRRIDAHRRAGGRGSRAQPGDGHRALAGGAKDRRRREADPRHRPPDQPSRAQRHDRGGAGRRGGQGVRGGRLRGQDSGETDRRGDPGHHRASRGDLGLRRDRRSARSTISARSSTALRRSLPALPPPSSSRAPRPRRSPATSSRPPPARSKSPRISRASRGVPPRAVRRPRAS